MIRSIAVAAMLGLGVTAASAQMIYQPGPPHKGPIPFPYSDPSPYAQAYGEVPSYEIFSGAYGHAPGVRVTQRCLYPNGWNVTDFDRELNGIPPGISMQCPAPQVDPRIRARYRADR